MSRMTARRLRMQVAAALVAAATLLSPSFRAAAQPALSPLGGVDQLKAWFNANQPHLRLVLLLAPT